MSGHHENNEPKPYGIIAEFDDPDALLDAAKQAYHAGYRKMDCYSPFPIHGLEDALGFPRTKLPWFTLVAGLTGAIGGFGMQYYASVVHYPYDIGGRPNFSWPAFIPVTFELNILFAAFTTGFVMLALNGLPRLNHPIHNAKNFERATSDRFFLCIECIDGQFDNNSTRTFMEGLSPQPLDVSEVTE
ncbi:MAG: hypothetical protein COA73_04040 [Candidatus Hydrogenedentota bacterium]|nr:MAG: hypothetical protein COA73_04040 [Candidatus Hydrogenedentota bacterium]